jgi:hypothetical protein
MLPIFDFVLRDTRLDLWALSTRGETDVQT